MRNFTILSILTMTFILISPFAFQAQGNIEYTLIVQNNYHKAIPGINIQTTETSTLEQHSFTTNKDGIVRISLAEGKSWKIKIGKISDAIILNSVPFSVLTSEQVYIYDYKSYIRKRAQVYDRKEMDFKIIQQGSPTKNDVTSSASLLKYYVHNKLNKPQSNVKISIVNLNDSIIFIGKTNANGQVNFLLPNHTKYDVDFGTAINYSHFDTDNQSTIWTQEVEFTKTIVNETNKNDTLIQRLSSLTQPSSERTLVTINISGGKKNGVNETVQLVSHLTGQVYQNKSNIKQQVQFLVPHSQVYYIHLPYQQNVDIIDLRNLKEYASFEIKIKYTPNLQLEYPERYFPTPESLYLPALSTYLNKQFEKPTKGVFGIKIRQARTISPEAKEALFLLEIAGKEKKYEGKRSPLNVCFVLDKSGSMFAENRTLALKTALWKMGGMFMEKDNVNFVLFDQTAVKINNEEDHTVDIIRKIIENYTPSGGTNIYNGLQIGIATLQENYDPSILNKIILLTDGYGITPPEQILNKIATSYTEGIEFSTVGLGSGCNLSLLELISKKGNGTFNVVSNPQDLSHVMLNEIDESFSYLATEVAITITHDQQLILKKLYGYPLTQQSNTNIQFEIAKVPVGLNQIAFLKFKLTKPDASIENKPIQIKIEYFDISLHKMITETQIIYLKYTPETNSEYWMDAHEKEMYALAILNQTIKVIVEYRSQNHFDQADHAAKSCRYQLKQIFPKSTPKEVKQLLMELDKYMAILHRIREQSPN